METVTYCMLLLYDRLNTQWVRFVCGKDLLAFSFLSWLHRLTTFPSLPSVWEWPSAGIPSNGMWTENLTPPCSFPSVQMSTDPWEALNYFAPANMKHPLDVNFYYIKTTESLKFIFHND